MFGILVVGVVGYYVGLYSFLWVQLYSSNQLITDKIVPRNLLKYKQL